MQQHQIDAAIDCLVHAIEHRNNPNRTYTEWTVLTKKAIKWLSSMGWYPSKYKSVALSVPIMIMLDTCKSARLANLAYTIVTIVVNTHIAADYGLDAHHAMLPLS